MKTRIFLLIALMAMIANANAWTLTEKVAGGSALAIGGGIIYSECNTANADFLDQPAEKMNASKCIDVLKAAVKSGLVSIKSVDDYLERNAEATEDNSTLRISLRKDRVASGGPPEDPNKCEAHHIVPQKEGRPWAFANAENARKILRECNIGINSAINGVYLPGNESSNSECVGTYHKGLHTKEYYRIVSQSLDLAKSSAGCDGVKDMLEAIKARLESGQM